MYRMIIELMKRLPNVSLLREITQTGSHVGKEKKLAFIPRLVCHIIGLLIKL